VRLSQRRDEPLSETISGNQKEAEMTNQHVSEKLLQMSIERSISEKLSGLTREFGEFTKGMNEVEKKAAAIMILGMVETACGDFFTKMKARIEDKKV